MLSVTEVDRVSITTVVDNYVDVLRQDEKVARRFSAFSARQMPDLDRKSTRLNSSHRPLSRMPSSA